MLSKSSALRTNPPKASVPEPQREYAQRLQNLDRKSRLGIQIPTRGQVNQRLPRHTNRSSLVPQNGGLTTECLDSSIPRGPNCITHVYAHKIALMVSPLLTVQEKDISAIEAMMTAKAREIFRRTYGGTVMAPTFYDDRVQMQVAYYWATKYNRTTFEVMGSELLLGRAYFEAFIFRFATA